MMMRLPFFITVSMRLSGMVKGTLISLFDIGGVIGSILFGWLIDRVGSRNLVHICILLFSVPDLLTFKEA
jgi:MFS family permease